jgi:hypothetical protein
LGGAIRFVNLGSNPASMSVTNSTFTGNEAIGGPGGNAGGGAILVGAVASNSPLSTSVTIDGCTLSGNVAQGGDGGTKNGGDGLGGGIWIGSATVCINNSSITDNQALGGAPRTSGQAGHGVGGGIYIAGATIVGILDTVITGNLASSLKDDVFGHFDTDC